MKQYLNLLKQIRHNGVDKGDRTGTGQREIFGAQLRFNLSEGFPLVTTKKMFLKGIIHELLWFLKGDTNIKYLNDNGVHIWDAWADENGDLGPVYGSQWRKWPNGMGENLCGEVIQRTPIDQIDNLIKEIKETPDSRRMMVTAWNPAEVNDMALPPCHCMMQFNVRPLSLAARKAIAEERGWYDQSSFNSSANYIKEFDEWGVPNGKLSCQMYQRSADMFLGVPFNIASYALLTTMLAQVCDLVPGKFIHTFGSAHIYHNHFEQVDEQLKRSPHRLPVMIINPEVKDIDDFKYEDFELVDYTHEPGIKAPIAV